MSKIFAVIVDNVVLNVVVADGDSYANENENWVDITEYTRNMPTIGCIYVDNKFCKRAPIYNEETMYSYKIKANTLSANLTISLGDWIYQGNSYDNVTFSGFVKTYDSNTKQLIYYGKEGILDTNNSVSIMIPDAANSFSTMTTGTFTLDTLQDFPDNIPDDIKPEVRARINVVTRYEFTVKPTPRKVPKIITKFGFRMRMTNLEYAGILEAAKTDSLVQAWVETFNMMNTLDLEAANIISDVEMLVQKGLISQDRSLVLLSHQIQPNEMP